MKKIIVLFVAIFLVSFSFSENVNYPSMIPPSPNAQTFLKYGEYPVSNYTGVPDISIPIYTINLKDLQIPINLNYNASGIKVEEEASRVGLGWLLNAGGIISHTIKGRYNDFNGKVYFNKYNVNKLKDLNGIDNIIDYTVFGGNYASFSLPDSLSEIDFKYAISDNYVDCGIIELAPDVFNYNFLGFSGKFIFGRDGNIIKEKKDNIQIIPSIKNSMLPISLESFEVITPDGTKFYFNQTEKSSFGEFVGVNNIYNSSFYLTKIETINKTVVDFNYDKNGFTLGTYNKTYVDNLPDININYSTHEIIRLREIKYPGGHIQINYAFDRLDYSSEPRIQSIQIYEENVNTSTWHFNPNNQQQMYFVSNVSSFEQPTLQKIQGLIQSTINIYNNDWNTKRLKLNELKHIDKDNNSYSYNFLYNNTYLPSKLSTSVDHWGYYNGKYNHNFIPAFMHNISNSNTVIEQGVNDSTNRDADENFNQAFILNQIIYPTGGKTEFTYESNKFKMNVMENDPYKRDFMYSKQEISIQENSTTGLNNIPYHLKNFTIPYASGNPGGGYTSKVNVKLDLILNSAYKNRTTGEPKLIISILKNNNVVWSYIYQSPETPDSYQFTGNTWPFSKVFENIELYAGEYTMKIDCQEGDMRIYLDNLKLSIIRTIYPDEFLASHPVGIGGGIRVKEIRNFDSSGELINCKNFKYTSSDDDNQLNSSGKLMSYPHYRNSWKSIGGQGLLNNSYSVGYSEVSVFNVNKLNILVDKIKYKFINIPNKNLYYSWNEQISGVPIEINRKVKDINPVGVESFQFAENGTITNEILYKYNNGVFNKNKEIEYKYEIVNNKNNDIYWGVIKSEFIPENYPVCNRQMTDYYRNEFVDKYLPGMLAIGYLYPVIRPVWIKNTEKKEIIYHTTGAITIETKNEYDSIYYFQVKKSIISSDNNNYNTTFKFPFNYENDLIMKDLTNRNIILNQIETIKKVNGRITDHILREFNYLNEEYPQLVNVKTNTGPGFTLENKLKYLNYDKYGNPIRILKNNVENIINVWSYSGQLLVAEIKNASFSEVESAIKAVFFVYSFDEFSNLIKPNELALRNGSLQKLLPNSQVTTFTHKPLVGITSMTDPRGVTTYYEYDAYDRLKSTKDKDGNMLQNNSYHYANEQ